MPGTFELKRSGKQFMFNLKSSNGRVILTSERYKSKDEYVGLVKQAAEKLAAQGYVLERDIPRMTQFAASKWDYVTGAK